VISFLKPQVLNNMKRTTESDKMAKRYKLKEKSRLANIVLWRNDERIEP
jgi:hypothetical protein